MHPSLVVEAPHQHQFADEDEANLGWTPAPRTMAAHRRVIRHLLVSGVGLPPASSDIHVKLVAGRWVDTFHGFYLIPTIRLYPTLARLSMYTYRLLKIEWKQRIYSFILSLMEVTHVYPQTPLQH